MKVTGNRDWQKSSDILRLRAYACEVAVSLMVDGVDVKDLCRSLMNNYAFGTEMTFRAACHNIIKKVV